MNADQRLKQIAAELDGGGEPASLTVRELLKWFDAQRRGDLVVETIRSSLKRHKLQTVPDFVGEYLDHAISFEKLTASAKKAIHEGEEGPLPDPTYRIGKLEAANLPPVYVKPDDPIEKAVTLMLTNDFSQLPVMTNEREAKGVVTWMSIGSRKVLGQSCEKVRNCMEKHVEISAETSIFDAINDIIEAEYALVRGKDKIISGIVTTSDLSLQFQQLGEPFLIIGEIENYIRRLFDGKFTKEELDTAKNESDFGRKVERVHDLTFGEYRRLLENPDHWSKLNLALDRKEFVAKLEQVRRIRNEVMHFDPDGIPDSDLMALREFVGFLQRLAAMDLV